MVHVVVVGCGRVGSGLAGSLEEQGHTVAVIDRRPTAFRRLPEDFAGRTHRRRRLRPRPARRRRASRRPARSPRSPTATTRTSSWPASPARTFGDRAGRRPHLRPAPRRRSTSASASPPSPPCSGPPSGCCAASFPTRPAVEWIDPTRQGGAGRARGARHVGRAAPRRPRRSPAWPGSSAVTRLGVGAVPTPGLVGPGGRRRVRRRAPATDRRRSTTHLADADAGRPLMRVVIAGGGNVGTFIADELHRGRPRRHDRRERPERVAAGAAARRAGRRDAGCRPTPARSTSCAGRARARPTWSPPSPATTRTTS